MSVDTLGSLLREGATLRVEDGGREIPQPPRTPQPPATTPEYASFLAAWPPSTEHIVVNHENSEEQVLDLSLGNLKVRRILPAASRLFKEDKGQEFSDEWACFLADLRLPAGRA